MSDYANILYFLEESNKLYRAKSYLNAAVSAFWCLKYCEEGEPYGISAEKLCEARSKARSIYNSCLNRLPSPMLSKTTFVYGTICPKLLWLYKHKFNYRHISDETQQKFDYGHNIGSLAQKLFTNGIDASVIGNSCKIDMSRITIPFKLRQHIWIKQTADLYNDHTIYEAAFEHNGVFAAVDILERGTLDHIAYEVKCSSKISDTFLTDCALQLYVISHHCKLKDFFLIYINESYLQETQIPFDSITESNIDIERLFIKESVLSRILPLQEKVKAQIESFKLILSQKEPSIPMGCQCSAPYECMFSHYCSKKQTWP